MADLIVDEQFDAVSRLVPDARAHPDAVRFSQILEHAFRSALLLGLGRNLGFTLRVSAAFCDEIQPNERKRLLGINNNRVILDARRDSNRIGKRGQSSNHTFRHASRRRDFQIVLAGESFHRTTERAGGGTARKIDGQDNSDPQGDSQDCQQSPYPFTEERTHHQSVKEQKTRHFSAG